MSKIYDHRLLPGSWFLRLARDYKNLDQITQDRVDEALGELEKEEQPRSHGEHKYGQWDCVYNREIGRGFRILYDMQDERHEIVLIRVGTHKI